MTVKRFFIKISGLNDSIYSHFFPIKKTLSFLMISFLLTGCTETDNLYSSAYCYFTFNTSLYPSSALTRAVAGGGGDFCMVKASYINGVPHLRLTPNRGTYAATDLNLTMSTAISDRPNSYAAMGYRQGLIIGRSFDGQLRCYDLTCPNCDNTPDLTWSQQSATDLQCPKCQRIYNIDGEYGYVKEGGQGHALTQYRNARYTPDNGLLIISNP